MNKNKELLYAIILTVFPIVLFFILNIPECEYFLIELFKKEEFPVDTHINRIAKRLGIADDFDDISVVEVKLKSFFKNYSYINLHHQIILFGRNICNAKNPKCQNCGLKTICKYYEKLNS